MITSGGTAVCTDSGRNRSPRPRMCAASPKKRVAQSRNPEDLVADLREQTRRLEAQLLHAQRMETFARVLPGVVHDFNHLLTHIIGFTELSLAGLPPGDRNQGNLETVREAGKKATDLTRKLLSYCRQQDPHLDVLDVSFIVAGVGRLFQRILGEGIELTFDLATSPRPVMGDVIQMEQILMNLVVNARDAMPAGGRIVFETRDVDLKDGNAAGLPAGGYVVVAVEDSGPGIPPAIQDRIFEPFFTTKAKGQGTGLGLSTVMSIVRRHHGQVLMQSEEGKGCRFSIYLPVIPQVL